jgi:putative transposase
VKVREGAVRVKAVYLAIGITMTGEKEVLGLWLAQTEGAKFWLQVVTELRNRGVQDIFIACVDGLKGFPDAIEAVFPKAVVQLCIVHMVRHSLNYVSWKRRKEVAADLRRIYTATTAEEAELMLGEFEARWDAEYLPIGQSWRRNWSRLTPFFDYPPEIRKVIYTTNAIESVNMSLTQADQEPGLVPQRRGADQAVLPGAAQHQPEVDHAHPGLEGRADPLYHSVRRPHLRQLKSDPFTQRFGHALRADSRPLQLP